MNKLILVLFSSMIFIATASYAEEKSIEELQAQMAEMQDILKNLEASNEDLQKRLGSKEKEIDGLRTALEGIEEEIAALASSN